MPPKKPTGEPYHGISKSPKRSGRPSSDASAGATGSRSYDTPQAPPPQQEFRQVPPNPYGHLPSNQYGQASSNQYGQPPSNPLDEILPYPFTQALSMQSEPGKSSKPYLSITCLKSNSTCSSPRGRKKPPRTPHQIRSRQ